MYCENCGAEIVDNTVQICPKCGTNVRAAANGNVNERKRHGFTSFWLIFSLISYFSAGAFYLFAPQLITQYYNASSWLIALYGVVSMAGIIGNILLLCWKKIGFWIFIGISVVSLLLNMAIGFNFLQALWGLIGIAIMWGILHIRKNGKTTWEQLQ